MWLLIRMTIASFLWGVIVMSFFPYPINWLLVILGGVGFGMLTIFLSEWYIPTKALYNDYYDKETMEFPVVKHDHNFLTCKHPEKRTYVRTTGGAWFDDAFEGEYCTSCGRTFNERQTY